MSGHIVTQGIWERNQPYTADKVLVRNLSVTANAGVDVWGRQKEQPALISVTLSLSERFKSAAEGDVVDRSTVHYGKMSKNIIAAVQERAKAGWLSTHQLALLVEEAACKTAAEPSLISACEVTIYYPKASMLGEGAGMIHSRNSSNGEVSRVLYLRNVRIPCLIGVNSHERKMKQAVIANLWIDCLGEGSPGDGYTTAERILTETIEQSSFETIESLVESLAAGLKSDFISKQSPEANIRLRVEKPVAVPFADAPAIEIFRSP